MNEVDLGNKCVHCKEDTSFGSGKFVNRYPVFGLDPDGTGTEYDGDIVVMNVNKHGMMRKEYHKLYH